MLDLSELSLEEHLEDYTDDIRDTIQANTPERTGLLVDSIEKTQVKKTTLGLEQIVYIDDTKVPYAIDVEEGMGKEFKYHKPKGVEKWTGDGRHMVRDTFLSFQTTIGQKQIF